MLFCSGLKGEGNHNEMPSQSMCDVLRTSVVSSVVALDGYTSALPQTLRCDGNLTLRAGALPAHCHPTSHWTPTPSTRRRRARPRRALELHLTGRRCSGCAARTVLRWCYARLEWRLVSECSVVGNVLGAKVGSVVQRILRASLEGLLVAS